MSKTVSAFGREWCHQQFHGLVKEIVCTGLGINISGTDGHFEVVAHHGLDVGRGYGPTIWLALVSAVEKMEGE